MMNFKFEVPGRPVPAVRMTQRSKWTNQSLRYLAYKESFGWTAKSQNVPYFEGNVEVSAIAYLCGHQLSDVDNLAKSFLDSLNKIAWRDDSQVQKLTIERVRVHHKNEQRAVIEIKEYKQYESA